MQAVSFSQRAAQSLPSPIMLSHMREDSPPWSSFHFPTSLSLSLLSSLLLSATFPLSCIPAKSPLNFSSSLCLPVHIIGCYFKLVKRWIIYGTFKVTIRTVSLGEQGGWGSSRPLPASFCNVLHLPLIVPLTLMSCLPSKRSPAAEVTSISEPSTGAEEAASLRGREQQSQLPLLFNVSRLQPV